MSKSGSSVPPRGEPALDAAHESAADAQKKELLLRIFERLSVTNKLHKQIFKVELSERGDLKKVTLSILEHCVANSGLSVRTLVSNAMNGEMDARKMARIREAYLSESELPEEAKEVSWRVAEFYLVGFPEADSFVYDGWVYTSQGDPGLRKYVRQGREEKTTMTPLDACGSAEGGRLGMVRFGRIVGDGIAGDVLRLLLARGTLVDDVEDKELGKVLEQFLRVQDEETTKLAVDVLEGCLVGVGSLKDAVGLLFSGGLVGSKVLDVDTVDTDAIFTQNAMHKVISGRVLAMAFSWNEEKHCSKVSRRFRVDGDKMHAEWIPLACFTQGQRCAYVPLVSLEQGVEVLGGNKFCGVFELGDEGTKLSVDFEADFERFCSSIADDTEVVVLFGHAQDAYGWHDLPRSENHSGFWDAASEVGSEVRRARVVAGEEVRRRLYGAESAEDASKLSFAVAMKNLAGTSRVEIPPRMLEEALGEEGKKLDVAWDNMLCGNVPKQLQELLAIGFAEVVVRELGQLDEAEKKYEQFRSYRKRSIGYFAHRSLEFLVENKKPITEEAFISVCTRAKVTRTDAELLALAPKLVPVVSSIFADFRRSAGWDCLVLEDEKQSVGKSDAVGGTREAKEAETNGSIGQELARRARRSTSSASMAAAPAAPSGDSKKKKRKNVVCGVTDSNRGNLRVFMVRAESELMCRRVAGDLSKHGAPPVGKLKVLPIPKPEKGNPLLTSKLGHALFAGGTDVAKVVSGDARHGTLDLIRRDQPLLRQTSTRAERLEARTSESERREASAPAKPASKATQSASAAPPPQKPSLLSLLVNVPATPHTSAFHLNELGQAKVRTTSKRFTDATMRSDSTPRAALNAEIRRANKLPVIETSVSTGFDPGQANTIVLCALRDSYAAFLLYKHPALRLLGLGWESGLRPTDDGIPARPKPSIQGRIEEYVADKSPKPEQLCTRVLSTDAPAPRAIALDPKGAKERRRAVATASCRFSVGKDGELGVKMTHNAFYEATGLTSSRNSRDVWRKRLELRIPPELGRLLDCRLKREKKEKQETRVEEKDAKEETEDKFLGGVEGNGLEGGEDDDGEDWEPEESGDEDDEGDKKRTTDGGEVEFKYFGKRERRWTLQRLQSWTPPSTALRTVDGLHTLVRIDEAVKWVDVDEIKPWVENAELASALWRLRAFVMSNMANTPKDPRTNTRMEQVAAVVVRTVTREATAIGVDAGHSAKGYEKSHDAVVRKVVCANPNMHQFRQKEMFSSAVCRSCGGRLSHLLLTGNVRLTHCRICISTDCRDKRAALIQAVRVYMYKMSLRSASQEVFLQKQYQETCRQLERALRTPPDDGETHVVCIPMLFSGNQYHFCGVGTPPTSPPPEESFALQTSKVCTLVHGNGIHAYSYKPPDATHPILVLDTASGEAKDGEFDEARVAAGVAGQLRSFKGLDAFRRGPNDLNQYSIGNKKLATSGKCIVRVWRTKKDFAVFLHAVLEAYTHQWKDSNYPAAFPFASDAQPLDFAALKTFRALQVWHRVLLSFRRCHGFIPYATEYSMCNGTIGGTADCVFWCESRRELAILDFKTFLLDLHVDERSAKHTKSTCKQLHILQHLASTDPQISKLSDRPAVLFVLSLEPRDSQLFGIRPPATPISINQRTEPLTVPFRVELLPPQDCIPLIGASSLTSIHHVRKLAQNQKAAVNQIHRAFHPTVKVKHIKGLKALAQGIPADEIEGGDDEPWEEHGDKEDGEEDDDDEVEVGEDLEAKEAIKDEEVARERSKSTTPRTGLPPNVRQQANAFRQDLLSALFRVPPAPDTSVEKSGTLEEKSSLVAHYQKTITRNKRLLSRIRKRRGTKDQRISDLRRAITDAEETIEAFTVLNQPVPPVETEETREHAARLTNVLKWCVTKRRGCGPQSKIELEVRAVLCKLPWALYEGGEVLQSESEEVPPPTRRQPARQRAQAAPLPSSPISGRTRREKRLEKPAESLREEPPEKSARIEPTEETNRPRRKRPRN